MLKRRIYIVGILWVSMLVSVANLDAQSKNLEEYTNTALKNSPVLKDYYGQIEQNKIDSILTNSNYKPQVNLTGQALVAPTYGKYGYDEAITNGGNYEGIASVSQLIAPRKEINTNKKLSNVAHQSLSNQAKQAELQLRKDVADKYLAICLVQQQQIFVLQSDSFLVKELGIFKNLTEKGIYKVSDYYELLVEEQSEHSEIAQQNLQMLQAFSELNEACGITDTATYKLTIPKIEAYKQNDYRQLNGFQKFQVDSMQFAFQNQLLDAQYNPHLSWYADAGVEASQPNLIYRSFGNSFGLNLSMPLYDGHKKDLKHHSLKISDDIRANYESFFVQTYNTHTSMLAKQIDDASKIIIQLRKEEEQVDNWKKVNQTLLETANISITDFLLSIKKELEVKNNIVQAMINQQQLQNEFNYWNH
jgi:outer membrane protein TolC